MTPEVNRAPVDIPKRETRRVRLDLDVAKADKLRDYARAKGRPQNEIVEIWIDQLTAP